MSLKQESKTYYKLSGMLLLAAAILLCAFPHVAAAEETTPAVSEARTAPCKELKPFNNLDELLYQFYINLDSDCLFKMPVEELEKVWDIKILNRNRETSDSYSALIRSPEFSNKPFKSEKDSFYVEIVRSDTGRNRFYLSITREYAETNFELFPFGIWPKLLPEPVWSFEIGLVGRTYPCWEGAKCPVRPGQIGHTYTWYSSDKRSMIRFKPYNGITSIVILRSGR